MASTNARSVVLGRIRDILGGRPGAAAEYGGITREYLAAPGLPLAERIELFAERLRHYQVDVYRGAVGALARTLGDVLSARGKSRLLVPADLPQEWLPSGLQVMADENLSFPDLDRSEGVVTGCSLAIASTGTIVLRHQRAEGRRALTLVPDYHLCVVFEQQVVQTVPEAIRQLAAWGPGLVTTISGPSATADIEMTRIRGVHGPRTLDVMLIA
jgi:L-lactate dehydrogenase complex protein LldG